MELDELMNNVIAEAEEAIGSAFSN